MYRELIDDVLQKYGTLCDVYPRGSDDVRSIMGFISPKRYVYSEFGACEGRVEGMYDNRYYELICSAQRIDVGSMVVIDGTGYVVSSSERYILGGEVLYTRCTLKAQGEWNG
ncbi:MAG: hypothetical protein IIZ59_01465 [Clostridia bacterium]|nr:hypothetical protein [Clostridia bacterium]